MIYWRNKFHKLGPKWPNLHDYTNWDFFILKWKPTPIDQMVGFIFNQRKTNKTTTKCFNASFPFGLVIPLPTPFSQFFLLKFPNTSSFSTFSKFIYYYYYFIFFFGFVCPLLLFCFASCPSPFKVKKKTFPPLICFIWIFLGAFIIA